MAKPTKKKVTRKKVSQKKSGKMRVRSKTKPARGARTPKPIRLSNGTVAVRRKSPRISKRPTEKKPPTVTATGWLERADVREMRASRFQFLTGRQIQRVQQLPYEKQVAAVKRIQTKFLKARADKARATRERNKARKAKK